MNFTIWIFSNPLRSSILLTPKELHQDILFSIVLLVWLLLLASGRSFEQLHGGRNVNFHFYSKSFLTKGENKDKWDPVSTVMGPPGGEASLLVWVLGPIVLIGRTSYLVGLSEELAPPNLLNGPNCQFQTSRPTRIRRDYIETWKEEWWMRGISSLLGHLI